MVVRLCCVFVYDVCDLQVIELYDVVVVAQVISQGCPNKKKKTNQPKSSSTNQSSKETAILKEAPFSFVSAPLSYYVTVPDRIFKHVIRNSQRWRLTCSMAGHQRKAKIDLLICSLNQSQPLPKMKTNDVIGILRI